MKVKVGLEPPGKSWHCTLRPISPPQAGSTHRTVDVTAAKARAHQTPIYKYQQPAMDPRLCSNCRFIFEDPGHQKIRDTSMPRHQRHDYFASGVHHTSYQSLCDAIAAQCPICVTVLPICVPGEANPPPQTNPDEYTTYRIDYSCGDPSRTPKLLPKIWLHFYVGKGPGARSLYLVNLLPDHAGMSLSTVGMFVLHFRK